MAAVAGPDLRRVGFVGAGRMAEAIAQGLIQAGGSRGGVRQRPGVRGRAYLAGAHLPAGMNPAEPLGEEPGQPGPCAQWSQGGAGPGSVLTRQGKAPGPCAQHSLWSQRLQLQLAVAATPE